VNYYYNLRTFLFFKYFLQWHLFLAEFSASLLAWSFRNHSNMLFSYYKQNRDAAQKLHTIISLKRLELSSFIIPALSVFVWIWVYFQHAHPLNTFLWNVRFVNHPSSFQPHVIKFFLSLSCCLSLCLYRCLFYYSVCLSFQDSVEMNFPAFSLSPQQKTATYFISVRFLHCCRSDTTLKLASLWYLHHQSFSS